MDYIIQGETLEGIADAIREKTGKTDKMLPTEFAEEITSIIGGDAPTVETWVLTMKNGNTEEKEVLLR